MKEIPAIIEDLNHFESAVLSSSKTCRGRTSTILRKPARQPPARPARMNQTQLAKRIGLPSRPSPTSCGCCAWRTISRRWYCSIILPSATPARFLKIDERKKLIRAIQYIGENRLNVSQSEEYIRRLMSEPENKPTRLFVVKDLRIFMNTINKALSTMVESGIKASSEQTEDEDFISIRIRSQKECVPQKEHRIKSTTSKVLHKNIPLTDYQKGRQQAALFVDTQKLQENCFM